MKTGTFSKEVNLMRKRVQRPETLIADIQECYSTEILHVGKGKCGSTSGCTAFILSSFHIVMLESCRLPPLMLVVFRICCCCCEVCQCNTSP